MASEHSLDITTIISALARDLDVRLPSLGDDESESEDEQDV